MANTKLSQRRRQDARPLPLWLCLLGGLGVTIGFVSLFAALWYIDVCGDTGFDSILFTLQSSLGGVPGMNFRIYSWLLWRKTLVVPYLGWRSLAISKRSPFR